MKTMGLYLSWIRLSAALTDYDFADDDVDSILHAYGRSVNLNEWLIICTQNNLSNILFPGC